MMTQKWLDTSSPSCSERTLDACTILLSLAALALSSVFLLAQLLEALG